MKLVSALAFVAGLGLAFAASANAQTYGANVNYTAHSNQADAPFAIRVR